MIKYVLIDVDDTIIDFHKSSEDSLRKMFALKGYPFKEDTMEIFHKVNLPLWKQVTEGKMTVNELRLIRFNEVFKALGIEGDGVEFEKMYKDYLTQTSFLMPYAEGLLKYLKPKYKVYAASNAHYDQQYNRLKLAGVLELFDGIFTSHEIGFEKPKAEFFEHCLMKLGNPSPSEGIMIGDNLKADIEGAKNCKISGIWYNFRERQGEEKIADYTVKCLKEITNIL